MQEQNYGRWLTFSGVLDNIQVWQVWNRIYESLLSQFLSLSLSLFIIFHHFETSFCSISFTYISDEVSDPTYLGHMLVNATWKCTYFHFFCIIQFDWYSKVSNVLNVSKLIVFFLLCILDMKPLFLIFVCWIGNALNFWPFTWIKKLRCWKIVKFETYFTCLWQVNEAVVSGWLFFRYLVIGGSTHSLFTFITTLVFAGLWPLFLVESCSFFFTLFVSDFLFFPLF